MKKSREEASRPNIVIRPEQEGEWHAVNLVITNTGGSPAHDIQLKYKIIKNDDSIKDFMWRNSVLQVSEKVRLLMETIPISDFFTENKFLKVELNYIDKNKKSYKEELSFDLKQLLGGIQKTFWAIEKDREWEISNSLKNISKSLENVSENVKYLADKPKEEYQEKSRKKIKKFIEERKNKEKK